MPKTLEELQAELEASQSYYGTGDGGYVDPFADTGTPEVEQNSGVLGDIVTGAQEGFYGTLADIAGFANIDSAEEYLEGKREEQRAEYSESGKEAAAEFGFGEGKTILNRHLIVELSKQLGQAPVFMVPGGMAAKGAAVGAKALGVLNKSRKALQTAKRGSDAAKVKKAQERFDKANKRLSLAAQGAGYGTINGMIIGEGSSDEVESFLVNRTEEEWFQDDAFVDSFRTAQQEGLQGAEAYEAAKKESIEAGRAEAKLKGFGLGTATGAVAGPLLQRAVTGKAGKGVAAGALTGAAAEAPTEFVEEYGQAELAGDIAGVDETHALERGLLGATLGGIIGTGIGAGGSYLKGSPKEPTADEARSILAHNNMMLRQATMVGPSKELVGPVQPTRPPEMVGPSQPIVGPTQGAVEPVTETLPDTGPTVPVGPQRPVTEAEQVVGAVKEVKAKEQKKRTDTPKVKPQVKADSDVKQARAKAKVTKAARKIADAVAKNEETPTPQNRLKVQEAVDDGKAKEAEYQKTKVDAQVKQEETVTEFNQKIVDDQGLQPMDTVKYGRKKGELQSIDVEAGTATVQKMKEKKGKGDTSTFVPVGEPEVIPLSKIKKDTEEGKGEYKSGPQVPLTPEQEAAAVKKRERIEKEVADKRAKRNAEAEAQAIKEEVEGTVEPATASATMEVNDKYSWDADNETFVDNETGEMFVSPPMKVAEKFLNDNNIFENNEDMINFMAPMYRKFRQEQSKSRKTNPVLQRVRKARAAYNKMESQELNGYEVDQAQKNAIIEEKAAAEEAWLIEEKTIIKEGTELAKGETVQVKPDEAVVAPEGVEAAVEGQEEVTVEDIEARVEEAVEEAIDKKAEEVKKAEAVIGEGKPEVKQEVKQEVKEEVKEEVRPTTRKEKRKAKAKAKTQTKWTADQLDDAIEDGVITHQTAVKMASADGVAKGLMTQKEADMWNEGDEDIDFAETNDWFDEKVNGVINRFGRGSEEHLWAVDNIEKHPTLDAMVKEEGSFSRTIHKLMAKDGVQTQEEILADSMQDRLDQAYLDLMEAQESGDRKAIIEKQQNVTFLEETMEDLDTELPNWATAPSPNVNTRNNVVDVITERFKRLPDNVAVIGTWNDLPADVKRDYPNSKAANAFRIPRSNRKYGNQIFIMADKVEHGTELNTFLHEMTHAGLQENKRWWQATVQNVERLAAQGDAIAVEAKQMANDAMKLNPDRLKRDPDAYNKELVAYMLTAAPESSFSQRVIRKLKDIVNRMFGMEMSSQDVIDAVVAMTESQIDMETQAEVDTKQAEYDAQMKDIMARADFSEMEEIELENNVRGSANPVIVSNFYGEERTYHHTLADVASTAWQWVKGVGLGFMPNRPLLDSIDRKLPEGISISPLQSLLDKSSAAANQAITKLNEGLLTDYVDYQRKNPQESKRLSRIMLNATYKNVDAEGNADYNTLGQEGQRMYREVRDHYKNMSGQKVEALRAYVSTLDVDSAKKRDMVDVINNLEGNLARQRVYFPFNRFGKWRVEGTMPNGYRYVAHHESKAAAFRELKARTREGYDLQMDVVRNYQSVASEIMTAEAYESAKGFIDKAGGNQEAQDALWDTFLRYSPQSALNKRMAKRKNVAGMSEDMVRGLNQSINRDIRYNERLKVQPSIDKVMSIVTAAIDEMPGDKTDVRLMVDELRKKSLYSDPRGAVSKNISKFNFLYYLGFNPASALINLTQNGIVGIPVLGSEHGFTRAAARMTKEFAHVVRNMTDLENMGYKGVDSRAFKALKDAQAIDVTQAHMMAGLNDSNSELYGGRMDKFMRASAFMFHRAEVANRATTAMSAFKLQYAKTGDFNGSVQYAADKTYEAQFDFSEEGKSRYQQTDVGNIALALKSYPINMAVYMGRNFMKAIKRDGATDEEVSVARKQLMGTMVVTTLLGGAAALPLTQVLPELYQFLFGDEGEDPMSDIREGLELAVGKTMSDVIMNGAVGTILKVDMQSKVNLGLDMFARVQGGASAEDWKDALIEGAMGPVGGMASNAFKGVDYWNQGKTSDAVASFMPTEIKNLMKAYKAGDSGIRTTSYDTKIEDASDRDVFLKAIGFNSDEYAEYFRGKAGERRAEESARLTKKRLLRDWSIAKVTGTYSEQQEARKAIMDYNDTVPRENRISRTTVRRSEAQFRTKYEGEEE